MNIIPVPPEARIWKETQAALDDDWSTVDNIPVPTKFIAKPSQCNGMYRLVLEMNSPAIPPNGIMASAKGEKYSPEISGDVLFNVRKKMGRK